jgi:hypothetical protein
VDEIKGGKEFKGGEEVKLRKKVKGGEEVEVEEVEEVKKNLCFARTCIKYNHF